jgi:hypothetical protein
VSRRGCASEGTSGKAGLSTVAKVAGAAVAAAGVAAAGAMKSSRFVVGDFRVRACRDRCRGRDTHRDRHHIRRGDTRRVVEDDDVVTYDASGQSLNEVVSPTDDLGTGEPGRVI